ncbi:VOC family protein [Vallitalea guaymasensis]|uniref:VOC family protein n=1 Tax=Vallitalea guaymasensis TaxID=1185412 RepID=UPI000DE37B9E|nr:VOC family protein [Vallitalea guaymasensis]
MKFAGICFVTENVKELKDFYSNIFDVKVEGDNNFAYFKFEEQHISIFSKSGEEKIAPGSMDGIGYGGCMLEFNVTDVDERYEQLNKLNVQIIKKPSTTPWGIRSVWFKDPDGNTINFCCKVK